MPDPVCVEPYAGMRERFAALPLPGLNWLPELFVPDAPLASIEDARHAMGGACMGLDPRTSVCSPDLNVHGIANLSIAGAATFPTGSSPLPALPMMALSLRQQILGGEPLAGDGREVRTQMLPVQHRGDNHMRF